ncbi:hypothetical protein GGI12_004606 [Dipsacomyces acuminosporus]|nr:hypothetical protein GGI12_004606 [Dipsacomyces acuminosporus]
MAKRYLVSKEQAANPSAFAQVFNQAYFRSIPLKLYHPYVQQTDGTIALLVESHFWRRDKLESICRVGSDLELFKVFNQELFDAMCKKQEFAVIERK